MAQTFGTGVPGAHRHTTAFVGFDSALEFWRDDSCLGHYGDCLDPEGRLAYANGWDLADAISGESEAEDLGIGPCSERPLDLLVPAGTKGSSDVVSLHRVGWKLPPRSFVRARDGVLVASPELTFLQAAATYPVAELLKLGMELCGTYAIDDYAQGGSTPRKRICSAAKIRQYLSRCPRVPGLAAARSAAAELIDNSNSPLESKVIIGLTLPAKKRGLGLWKPKLNERRDTTKLQAETIGQHTYFHDASWRGTLPSGRRYAVDCEIDSNPHFRDPTQVRSDGVRRDNVQYMNALHISITTEDFNDVDRFVQKGLMIAHHIGQRIKRYPRHGSEQDKAEFQVAWNARVARLGELLEELAADARPPRPRSR